MNKTHQAVNALGRFFAAECEEDQDLCDAIIEIDEEDAEDEKAGRNPSDKDNAALCRLFAGEKHKAVKDARKDLVRGARVENGEMLVIFSAIKALADCC